MSNSYQEILQYLRRHRAMMQISYVDVDGTEANCGVIAHRLADRLIELGEQPLLLGLAASDADEMYFDRLREGWNEHVVCVFNREVCDPIIGYPVPLEDYLEETFDVPVYVVCEYDHSLQTIGPLDALFKQPPLVPMGPREVRGVGRVYTVDPRVIDGDAKELFMHGQCHALALEFERSYGWPIYWVGDDKCVEDTDCNKYIDCEGICPCQVLHLVVRVGDDQYLDITGLHSAQDLIDSSDIDQSWTVQPLNAGLRDYVEHDKGPYKFHIPEQGLARSYAAMLVEQYNLQAQTPVLGPDTLF